MCRWFYLGCLGLGLCIVFNVAMFNSTMAASSSEREARVHFQRAQVAFDQKRYQDALDDYQKAYRIFPNVAFLFNIGQCYRNLGKFDDAVLAFKQYLQGSPNAPNRKAVDALIAELAPKTRNKNGTSSTTTNPTNEGALKQHPIRTPETSAQSQPKPRVETKLMLEAKPDMTASSTSIAVTPAREPDPVKRDKKMAFYRRWWFWTSAAVLIGGTVAGIFLIRSQNNPELPETPFPIFDVSL